MFALFASQRHLNTLFNEQVAPKAKQLLLLPFDGSHKQDILAVVAEAASPNVIFGDTTG